MELWIEKYKPTHLNDIELDETIKSKLNDYLTSNKIPNLIITGLFGIGKTLSINCLTHDLYGANYNSMVLHVDSANDKSINSSIDDMITFCCISCKSDLHKLIILDNSDNISDKGQLKISFIMEKYKNVNIIFICNDTSKFIDTIQSKCIILKYPLISNEIIINKLNRICKSEKITKKIKGIEEITKLSRGDIRIAINLLQLVYDKYEDIDVLHVDEICNIPQSSIINKILNFCIEKKLTIAITEILNLKHNGYSGSDILQGMFFFIKSDECNFPMAIKINFLEKISFSLFDISNSIDADLHLISCVCKLIDL